MKTTLIPFTLVMLGLVACGEDKKPETDHGQPHPQPDKLAKPADHGSSTNLGTLTVAGKQFRIVRLGDLVPGKESGFEVHPNGVADADLASMNVYLWVESQDGMQLSAAAKGSPEGGALHFHVTPRKGKAEPFRVVLRLRAEGTDERAGLPLDGHGHEHRDAPHHGVPATFQGGDVTGHLELKLHDDKGDLELWLGEDQEFTRPFDLPLNTSIEIEFIDVEGRRVSLRARNRVKNEDEDGSPNVRNGNTNYFMFPGQDGDDASWMKGKEFQSIVIVRFSRGDQSFVSEEFVLKPHVH